MSTPIALSSTQATALLNQLPLGARGPSSGFVYDGANLTIPDTYASEAAAIMAAEGWDSYVAPQAQLANFIETGLTVTSSGISALDGVYAIDAQTQADIAAEAQFVAAFGEFTNGGTTNLSWPLANGTLVTFPTTVEFMAFVKAVAQTVAAAKLAAAQGSAMPSNEITIP